MGVKYKGSYNYEGICFYMKRRYGNHATKVMDNLTHHSEVFTYKAGEQDGSRNRFWPVAAA